MQCITFEPRGRLLSKKLAFSQPLVWPFLIDHNFTDEVLVIKLREKKEDIFAASWR